MMANQAEKLLCVGGTRDGEGIVIGERIPEIWIARRMTIPLPSVPEEENGSMNAELPAPELYRCETIYFPCGENISILVKHGLSVVDAFWKLLDRYSEPR